MRRTVTAAVFVLVSASGWMPRVMACGDKFLVPVRGMTFTRVLHRQDASVLLYGSDGSDLLRMINTLSFGAALQKAGYRSTIVRTDADFRSALAQSNWDLVVVDFADKPPIGDGGRDTSGAAVLPVSYTLGGNQLKLARQQYPALVKAPKSSGAFLDMIDAALEKQRATKAKKP